MDCIIKIPEGFKLIEFIPFAHNEQAMIQIVKIRHLKDSLDYFTIAVEQSDQPIAQMSFPDFYWEKIFKLMVDFDNIDHQRMRNHLDNFGRPFE